MKNHYKLCTRKDKTYFITIPAEYVHENKLKAGDLIYFYYDNDDDNGENYKNSEIIISTKENEILPVKWTFYKSQKLCKRGLRGWVITFPLMLMDKISKKSGDYFLVEKVENRKDKLILR